MAVSERFDFDTVIERRGTGCAKWGAVPEDVLPMWVADMDFESPPAVKAALGKAVEHGVFGYMFPSQALPKLLAERNASHHGWEVEPESVLFTAGVMISVNMAVQAFASEGAFLIQPPVYHPFHYTADWSKVAKQEAPLKQVETDDGFTYEIDFDVLENAITEDTKVFLLCNPHNPIGRVWRQDELERIAALCIKHDLIMVSDEIHSDLILSESKHIPIAMLPGMKDRTITLQAPSKTFNLPGLSLSVAIIENPDLRKPFAEAGAGTAMMVMGEHAHPFINMMGYIGAEAAYRDGEPWLQAVLAYIEENRDYTHAFIREHMPDVKAAKLEGTYLQWLDFRGVDLPTAPGEWLLENAKVALNEGAMFGEGGAGMVRMNLATPRPLLEQGLNQIRDALAAR